MKRIISIIIILSMFLIILCSCGAGSVNQSDPYAPAELIAQDGEPAEGFTWKNDYSEIAITGYVGDKNEIVIPTKINGKPVTKIVDSAFSNFSAMKLLVIPETVLSIGKSAFENCTGLEKVIWYPSECNQTGTDLYPAFSGCTKFKTIEIKDSVRIISDYMFYGCRSLKTVTGCQNVVSIGKWAFANCGITSYPFNSNLTTIAEASFYGCLDLEELHIPSSVTKMAETSFTGAGNNLKSITVDKDNPNYKSDGNCLICISNKMMILGCASSVIPSDGSVEIISAFTGVEKLKSITIPEGVHTIMAYCFFACHGLESINLPKSITSIGVNAFESCTSLQSISIPSNITKIPDGAFYGCSKLSSVNFNNVTEIGKSAFENCTSLYKIKIPKTIIKIDSNAFRNAELPFSIEFEDNSFWMLTNGNSTVTWKVISSVYFGPLSLKYWDYDYCTAISTVLEKGVKIERLLL